MTHAQRVVQWQRLHGRNDLPWQNTRDPYRVWLSEIMLQQTQVSTVLTYFDRFLTHFPHAAALAHADVDAVLALWSGLGYYSRARNLHRCAQDVMRLHGGQFPRSAAVLESLPGIGRSTAAAIASLCFDERVAILDGNVKRVLTRVLGFGDDLSVRAHEQALWALANAALPTATSDMPRYTQGMMDLGATLCVRRKPHCLVCPLAQQCVAVAQGMPEVYPVKTRKLKRSAQSHWLLLAVDALGRVFLQQRPDTGIWARLYTPPLFDSLEALGQVVDAATDLQADTPFVHVLTHKDLHLHPMRAVLEADQLGTPACPGRWWSVNDALGLGLPAPVKKLIDSLL
jgi:A/G-specific adenine glycosylase